MNKMNTFGTWKRFDGIYSNVEHRRQCHQNLCDFGHVRKFIFFGLTKFLQEMTNSKQFSHLSINRISSKPISIIRNMKQIAATEQIAIRYGVCGVCKSVKRAKIAWEIKINVK